MPEMSDQVTDVCTRWLRDFPNLFFIKSINQGIKIGLKRFSCVARCFLDTAFGHLSGKTNGFEDAV